ncbi:hypothetical protein TCAP_00037 [Tolypocladium capitatum]|uniref:Uncharacterized protein n=1 Tax=Tolypocladium capitatum TaxID=45235 RepID=A0A2K3QRA2_9HYPO|nr:hypothetical protein TCAP_00037 [Tolypocladium capitatum]
MPDLGSMVSLKALNLASLESCVSALMLASRSSLDVRETPVWAPPASSWDARASTRWFRSAILWCNSSTPRLVSWTVCRISTCREWSRMLVMLSFRVENLARRFSKASLSKDIHLSRSQASSDLSFRPDMAFLIKSLFTSDMGKPASLASLSGAESTPSSSRTGLRLLCLRWCAVNSSNRHRICTNRSRTVCRCRLKTLEFNILSWLLASRSSRPEVSLQANSRCCSMRRRRLRYLQSSSYPSAVTRSWMPAATTVSGGHQGSGLAGEDDMPWTQPV